jgi:hypothetical protein
MNLFCMWASLHRWISLAINIHLAGGASGAWQTQLAGRVARSSLCGGSVPLVGPSHHGCLLSPGVVDHAITSFDLDECVCGVLGCMCACLGLSRADGYL